MRKRHASQYANFGSLPDILIAFLIGFLVKDDCILSVSSFLDYFLIISETIYSV